MPFSQFLTFLASFPHGFSPTVLLTSVFCNLSSDIRPLLAAAKLDLLGRS